MESTSGDLTGLGPLGHQNFVTGKRCGCSWNDRCIDVCTFCCIYVCIYNYIYTHTKKNTIGIHWIPIYAQNELECTMTVAITYQITDNQLDDPLSPLAIPVENLGKRILAGWQGALIHHFFIQTSHHTQSSAPGPSSSTCIHGLRSCAPFPTHTPSDSQQDKVMTTSNNCHTPPLAGPATLLRDTWSTGSRNTSISP